MYKNIINTANPPITIVVAETPKAVLFDILPIFAVTLENTFDIVSDFGKRSFIPDHIFGKFIYFVILSIASF